jgi:hypothetical protein
MSDMPLYTCKVNAWQGDLHDVARFIRDYLDVHQTADLLRARHLMCPAWLE